MEQSYGFSSKSNLGVTNADGTVNVRCRKCTRVICRVVPVPHQMISSIAECAVCKGVPEEYVKPKFVQANAYSAPVPIDISEPFILYEEEQLEYEKAKENNHPWLGMLKPLFKILFRKDVEDEPSSEDSIAASINPAKELKSKRVAKSKKSKGLFEID